MNFVNKVFLALFSIFFIFLFLDICRPKMLNDPVFHLKYVKNFKTLNMFMLYIIGLGILPFFQFCFIKDPKSGLKRNMSVILCKNNA